MIRPKRQFTILDLRDSPWVDGPGRTVLECALGLNNRKFRFIIGSFRPPHLDKHIYLDEARRRGLPAVEIQECRSLDFAVIRRLLEVINREQVDLVHSHEFRSNVFGLLAARLRGIPVVTTVHGWIANDLKGKLRAYIDRCILRFFDHIVTVSDYLQQMTTRTGVNPKKISIIPNTLELERYQIDRTRQPLRAELGLSHEEVLFAKIGRLSPEKGHVDLLKALAKVNDDGAEVHLAIIGIGPEEQHLRYWAANLGLKHKVHFCGYRQDMVNCYNSIDLVIQASYTEGMPNVILEALAMSVPVIATDVGGTNEILGDGLSGRLLPPKKPHIIAEAIRDFLARPTEYHNMAKYGHQRIIAEFNSRKRLLQMQEVYERFLAQGKKGYDL